MNVLVVVLVFNLVLTMHATLTLMDMLISVHSVIIVWPKENYHHVCRFVQQNACISEIWMTRKVKYTNYYKIEIGKYWLPKWEQSHMFTI